MSVHPVFDEAILDGIHLLEADAGTGKTWTIAGLVVRALVERELDLDRVLVVTFTNAAAAELAERIRQRIAQLERLLDDRLEARAATVDEPFCVAYSARLDEAQARRARSSLRVALARIDEMAVHTIHGYCQRVIDEHALSIGVPRGLPIGAGDSERIARRVADWWRSEALDGPAERLLLLALAGLAPASLERMVRQIVSLPLARVDPPVGDWRALASRAAAARDALADALRTDAGDLQRWLAVPGNAQRGRFQRHRVGGWLEALRAFCDARFPKPAREAIERFASERFGDRMPDSAIPGCCDALLALDDALPGAGASIAQEIARSLDDTRAADLAQASSLAFDDLLRVVREALVDPASGPALARTLRERHPVALIDECQDTDALQWDIVHRIHVDAAAPGTPGALVLVGDPKQSIYAFRGADLHSYLGARRNARRVHRLGENQRSHPALIEAVNALFAADDAFRVDGISFSPTALGARPRRAFDAGDDASRAPMTVVALEPGAGGEALSARDARRQAIGATVAEIARLLASGARYGDRTLQPADIAVLVNARWQGAQIKRALARAGIGAAEISRDSVLDTLECAELRRVIAAIADSADPARLRSALTTTLFGFDVASLHALEHEPDRMLSIAAEFARARETWERLGPIAALRPLLRAHGVGERLAQRIDGDRRLTNLGHLVSLLGEDAAAFRSPGHAARAWGRASTPSQLGDEDTRELRLESDENLVRILTVHKSKGLEFPVVFLPFAWSGKLQRSVEPCVRHERDASGAERAVLDLAASAQSMQLAAGERQVEDLRTLYVALTRAEQRCYVFWGAAAAARYAPLAWLLHGHDPASAGALAVPLDAAAVARGLERWRARADRRHPAAVALVDTPTLVAALRPAVPAATRTHAEDRRGEAQPDAQAPLLVARAFTARIPPASITTSFSAIASTLAGGESAIEAGRDADVVDRPDHDQPGPGEGPPLAAETPLLAAESPPLAAEPLPLAAADAIRFRFPAGSQAGVCLHGILEETAFDAPPEADLVSRWLARCGYARIDAAEVSEWLGAVLRAPLRAPDGTAIDLSRVPPGRQIREMDFHLGAHDVSDRAVLDALAETFPVEAAAGARRWSGFLRGFVDLVFEHAGRYYIVDWKSNHLGSDAGCYADAALDRAMRAHAYPLQASLYTLAVHRWLRRSLPGYDYERCFGGVFYVFLRGAGLDTAPGAPTGVHAGRPPLRTIERLDRLFGASAAGARARTP